MSDFAHARGCSREGVRPSHYLPGADVCPTCRRMVPHEPRPVTLFETAGTDQDRKADR